MQHSCTFEVPSVVFSPALQPHCRECVPKGTIILGDNKPIETYTNGENVLGANGQTIVQQTFERTHEGTLLQIKCTGMLPFSVTPEHPLLTANGYRPRRDRHLTFHGVHIGSFAWKQAKDIKSFNSIRGGDFLVVPRLNGTIRITELGLEKFTTKVGKTVAFNRHFSLIFPLNEKTAWLLGMYVAEGCATDKGAMFALGHHEKQYAEKIVSIAKDFGYKCGVYQKPTALVVVLRSRIFARAFPYWCGKGATNKKIPDFILLHEQPSILQAFLNGYLDGDGYVLNRNNSKKSVGACTVSKLLALQIQLLGVRLGKFFNLNLVRRAGMSLIMGRQVRIHDRYDMRWNAASNRTQYRATSNAFLVPIRQITEEHYRGTVNNLQTGDETYLISNVVVHNCGAPVSQKNSWTTGKGGNIKMFLWECTNPNCKKQARSGIRQ